MLSRHGRFTGYRGDEDAHGKILWLRSLRGALRAQEYGQRQQQQQQ